MKQARKAAKEINKKPELFKKLLNLNTKTLLFYKHIYKFIGLFLYGTIESRLRLLFNRYLTVFNVISVQYTHNNDNIRCFQ